MDTPEVLAWRDGFIEALDQTALPHQVRVLRIDTVDSLVAAIRRLAVRGAPVLGAAGALGVALAVRQGEREGWDEARLAAEIQRIAAARPTAVNLGREVFAVAARLPAGSAAVEAAALGVVSRSAEVSRRISERAQYAFSERMRANGVWAMMYLRYIACSESSSFKGQGISRCHCSSV